ncbi:MAG TPA: PH domain-containing protein [Sphingomicrobium sp.]|nr:PH domain-containing protein [Sphingomicrobium sp.]
MSSSDQAVGVAERLHPLYLVTGLGRGLRQMAGGYAAIGYFAATGSWGTALLLLAGIAVVLTIGVFLYWKRFEYRVGANEIRIDSGILSRTHRSIPFDRIQDVDISQGPVARLLGLARVAFETGASAGDKSDDGALAAISLARAAEIRELVRARRGAAVASADLTETEAAPIFAMDPPRVFLAGLFNFSLAVIAALFGATQTVGDVAGLDFFTRRFWRQALEAGSPIADFVLANQIAAGIAGTVLLLITGLVTGVARTVLRDFRFRLDRTPAGLRRRRGLLTLTDVTLPIKRTHAAIIGSGPLRNRFGWSDLKLQSLGKDEGKKGDHLVAPLARESEIAAILAQLNWRPVDPSSDWQRTSPAFAWGFTGALFLLLIPAGIQLAINPLIGLAAVAFLTVLVAFRWLSWRRTRFALDGDRLLIRSGWWRRRLILLPLANIQSVDLTENIFSRRFGLASLAIGVASGRGFSAHGIAAIPAPTARALRTSLLARFA